MDSSYAPQSPDLSYAPQSPDLAALDGPSLGNFSQHHQHRLPGALGGGNHGFGAAHQPTSIPRLDPQQLDTMPPRKPKSEDDDDDFLPDAPAAKRSHRVKQEPALAMDGVAAPSFAAASHGVKSEDSSPTLGCQLKTSFPVARIKRIMQADEDIGKVAQVTPTVVSRALELFMIKLISASASQARGPGVGGVSKGPKRILAQHLKRAVLDDVKFDFLNEIVDKVPDAPARAKKEAAASDSDEPKPKPKKRGKKRKDAGDDV